MRNYNAGFCYELGLASTAVPLSLVSFFASSVFLAAAICHAGMAARPDWFPLHDCTGFSEVEEGGAVTPLLAWPPVAVVSFACSLGAGVDVDWGAGVGGVSLTFGVGVGLCDCPAP
jgi:hypothetical protein